jgi:hypothetical protein
MAYTFVTFAQLKTALAQRLTDLTKQFWSDAELGAIVREVLQSFNALANFYREEFVFQSQANVTWYDLTNATQIPTTLRALSETDQTILSMMEYHLLEPQTPAYPLVWTGSLQFNVSDLLNAIQQTRDEVLSETVCTVTESLINAAAGRTFLIQTVLGLRRVVWIPASGFGFVLNTLMPSDLWAQQSFEAGFVQAVPGTPITYRLSTEPPLAFDVDIQPAVPGQYDILTINAGGDLTDQNSTVLPIPNDWCWVNKWGALAQLLGRDSVASDIYRAKYCQMRYQEGLAAMRAAPALLAARINDVPVVVTSVTAGDFYDANWQGATAGTPTKLYYAGLNMVGLGPTPSTNGHSVTANVVRNMVLPTLDADFVQIGRDDVAAILDESQHVAMFKCGGAEFASTFALHGNFLRRCTMHNSKLSAMSLFLEFMDGRAQTDERLHPSFKGVDAETAKA